MTEPAIGTAYQRLDRAIQLYVAEQVQAGSIVVDWSLSVEVDHGTASRSFLVFVSEYMTPWKVYGFGVWSYRKLMGLAQHAMDRDA